MKIVGRTMNKHNWEGISEFTAVAEFSSFTKAGLALSTSTAQVSRMVSQLEQRLNTKLLYRTTRQVSLTEEGLVFYRHTKELVEGLNNAENAISQLQTTPQGKIRLTAPTTYGERIVLPLINDFLLEYPDVTVETELTNHKLDLVEQGFDLAIRIGHLDDSTMMAKKLTSRRNYLCASPQYLTQFGHPTDTTELLQHQCLLGSSDTWRFNIDGKIRVIKPDAKLKYNSGAALTDAAMKGLGLALLPDYYVHALIEQGDLVSVLDSNQITDESVWALYPHNRQLSPKVNLLIKHLVKKINN